MAKKTSAKSARRQRGLGAAVVDLRGRQRLSRRELAEKTGLSTSFIREVETKGRNISWEISRRLAEGLGVTHPQLATLADRHEERQAEQKKKRSAPEGPLRITEEPVVPRGWL